MTDKIEQFGHAETTKPVALVDVRKEIVREIGMRRGAYPKWTHEGRNGYTREIAVHRIAAMESALRLFDATVAIASAAQGLRDAVLMQAVQSVTLHVTPELAEQWKAENAVGGRLMVQAPATDPVLRRVELLDAALATFDRYKVEPPESTEGSQDGREAAFR